MRFYGGTPLAYSACFDQRRGVVAMLNTGVVTLSNRDDACLITGFLVCSPPACLSGRSLRAVRNVEALPEEMQ